MFNSALSRNVFRSTFLATGAFLATNSFFSYKAYCSRSTSEQLDQILTVSEFFISILFSSFYLLFDPSNFTF